MKDITAIKGRYYIHELVEQGEHENQDFKFAVSDARKIARSISAFANHSGGRLLIGVKDNGVIAGVRNAEEEIYTVQYAAERYCTPSQPVEFTIFKVDPGVIVVRATVQPAGSLPVMVDEGAGKKRAYYRVADENIVAHPLMVETWKRRTSADGQTLTFESGSIASRVLQTLADGPMSVEQIAYKIHATVDTVADTIVTLAASSLLTFHFDGQTFLPAPLP